MSTTYDVIVIGCGVAGAFCCLRLAEKNKDIKVLGIELGRPPAKRRHQCSGWIGLFPNSDGKLFLSDLPKIAELVGDKKAKSAYEWVQDVLRNIDDFKITKDRSPSPNMEKKIDRAGYQITLNDHIQVYPKDIHALSKHMADTIEHNKNVSFSFDNEVKSIYKQRGTFIVNTEEQEYRAKKLVIAVGRSGWRWARHLYSNFGIINHNDTARFGIRVEMNASTLKDLNKSHCTLTKGGQLEVGPFSWFGTVIPEDHVDLAISAFRSNEARWKSDKVSFSLIGNRTFLNQGFEQTDRLGKLTFVLSNDRIIKERVSYILAGKSKVSLMHEYDWLIETIQELGTIMPEIMTRAYFHIPTIVPLAPSINIESNLESEIDGMFVVGESAGIPGILAASCMGKIAADSVCR
jgi:hypothetical protein